MPKANQSFGIVKLLSDDLKGDPPSILKKKKERQTVLISWLAKQARICNKAIGHSSWGTNPALWKELKQSSQPSEHRKTNQISKRVKDTTEKGHTFPKEQKKIHEIPTSWQIRRTFGARWIPLTCGRPPRNARSPHGWMPLAVGTLPVLLGVRRGPRRPGYSLTQCGSYHARPSLLLSQSHRHRKSPGKWCGRSSPAGEHGRTHHLSGTSLAPRRLPPLSTTKTKPPQCPFFYKETPNAFVQLTKSNGPSPKDYRVLNLKILFTFLTIVVVWFFLMIYKVSFSNPSTIKNYIFASYK